ncbi:glycosyltransferase [Paraclostridium bifermentans]|uniref:glycosyltransferase n=1 Tax=Paraclostridium bifermentans TaxID=1490 RepID=UPI00359C2E6D
MTKKNIMIIDIGKEYGGAENQILNLINELSPDYNIILVLNEIGEFINNLNDINCNIIKIKNTPLEILKNAKYISSCIIENNIDIINAHGIIASLIAVLANKKAMKKLVINIHSDSQYDFNGIKKIIYSFIELFTLRKADKIITVSKDLKYKIIERYKINKDKIININNGINIKHISNRTIKDDKFKFLFVGRLEKVKNVPFLINAMKELKLKGYNFSCDIVGSGSEEEQLKEIVNINNLESSINFLGYQEDISEFMIQSNLLLLTSNMEGMPIVIIEAFGYNLPVISSNVGGINEIITNKKTGILYEKNNMNEFVDILERILNNDIDLNSISNNAYLEYKTKWTSSSMSEKYMNVFEEIDI